MKFPHPYVLTQVKTTDVLILDSSPAMACDCRKVISPIWSLSSPPVRFRHEVPLLILKSFRLGELFFFEINNVWNPYRTDKTYVLLEILFQKFDSDSVRVDQDLL